MTTSDVHVIPVNDDIVHLESIACRCQPKIVYTDVGNGNRVIAHNAFDERESLHE